MNVFSFNHYQVMIDYVHNEGGYLELKKYMDHLPNQRKVGIIGATGDRRDEDIQNIGAHAAQIFDEIIIRHDKDGRGRSNEELTRLLMQGIKTETKLPEVKVISDEFEAVNYALQHATTNTLVFYSPDNVFKSN